MRRSLLWSVMAVLLSGVWFVACTEETPEVEDPNLVVATISKLELRDAEGEKTVSVLELEPGGTAQVRAYVEYTDKTELDVTGQSTWFSSDTAVVGLEPGAAYQLRAGEEGRATVYVTFQQQTSSPLLTVTVNAAPTVTPAPE